MTNQALMASEIVQDGDDCFLVEMHHIPGTFGVEMRRQQVWPVGDGTYTDAAEFLPTRYDKDGKALPLQL